MDRALPAALTFATSPLFETAMSLEDRFRQALADAISEVKSRLEAEFDATVTDVKAEADRDRTAALALADDARAAAVAEARSALQTELQTAFDGEKASLVATHESLIAQAADAARLEATRLAEAATADADRQRQEAQDALARVKADADATVEAIRNELRDAQASALRVREESEATIARLQAEHEAALARQIEEHTAAMSRLEAEQGTVATDLRAALDAATRERDEAARQRDELAADAARLREQADAGAAQMRDEFEQSTARLRAEFDAGMSQAHALAEATLASLRAEAQEAATLHSQAVDAHQSSALRMLESVRALDGSTSLTEVLDALTVGASKEAGRAAMLVVKGERLIGWRTLGFGALDEEPRAIEQSTSDVGALAAAVNTGRPAVTGTGSVLAAPAFSNAPADRAGLAVPLLVAGRPVAVLYADQGSASPATGWTSPVEVLVRHAARCLEGLAVQRATASRAGTARVAQSA
jgi:hypothetical protein